MATSFVVALGACASAPEGGHDVAAACPATNLTTASLPGAGGDGLVEETGFASSSAGLKMYVHAPKRLASEPAIVVALHGCTQSASVYTSAGWNELADRAGFVVVYPEQQQQNNSTRCFRWWEPAQTARDQGEAQAIASMVAHARTKYGASGKAFVTGLSAGAAMTAVMLATYPDVFDAGAVMSGLPYGCASSQMDAYTCMNPGKDQTPEAWAARAPALARTKPPRVAIWHGDADYIVRPANADQLVRQWTAVNGVSATPSSTESVRGAKHAVYKDMNGVPRVESWMVAGMGHGVALAPRAGCGKQGAYLLDVDICSTELAAAFFGIVTTDAGVAAPSGSDAPDGGRPPSGGGGSTSDRGASSPEPCP